MTHFVGAVVVAEKPVLTALPTAWPDLYGKDHFDIDLDEITDRELTEILAPFSENLEVERWIKKDELIAIVRKGIEDYRDGIYAEYAADPVAYRENHPHADEAHFTYLAEGFPKKLNWTDEECYQDAAQWYSTVSPSGAVLETYNPNSKWDWWVVGGRWEDYYREYQGESVEAYRERLHQILEDDNVDLPMPFVLVANGQWISIGEYGWFGIRDDAMEARQFYENALEATKDIDGYVVYIDFHI